MKKKQTLALLLAGAMLVPNAFAASPEDFHDFPTDWSAAGLRRAVDNGLLNGANGRIDGAGLLTRAQMAAIINRAFAAKKTADLSGYNDVSAMRGTEATSPQRLPWAPFRARTVS